MEEWFHENNLKQEVNSANSLVAETLELLHTCFPRWDKEGNKEGQGWAVSKFHGVTKFVHYVKLFGNAINFYGGIGECNHKKFVKETGRNTQKRIRTFTSQVAKRYYEGMTLEISQKAIDLQGIGNKMNLELAHHQENYEQNSFGLGTYKLTFVGLDHQGQFNDHHVCAKKN
jgi:hypothetical protein